MASGRLNYNSPSATTNTTLYQVPSATVASFSISVCNTNSTPVTIKIAISSNAGAPGSITAGEWIESSRTIDPYSSFERTGLVADADKKIVVWASATNVNFMAYGFEDSTA